MKKLLAIALFSISTAALSSSVTVQKTDDDFLKNSAHVDYVEYIKGQAKDVKIFSVSGGDPAMNGAHLNLAVFEDMEIGWNVFELGNVRQFKLLPSNKKGFLKIKLTKDIMDNNGNIIQEKSTLFLNIQNTEKGIIETEEIK